MNKVVPYKLVMCVYHIVLRESGLYSLRRLSSLIKKAASEESIRKERETKSALVTNG